MIQIVQRGDLFRSYIVSLTFDDSAVYNMDSKQVTVINRNFTKPITANSRMCIL